MPQAFPVVEFGVMTALLGIKFLVSKIRNRESCRPLGTKKSRKEEDSKYRKVKNLDINLEIFLFWSPHTKSVSKSYRRFLCLSTLSLIKSHLDNRKSPLPDGCLCFQFLTPSNLWWTLERINLEPWKHTVLSRTNCTNFWSHGHISRHSVRCNSHKPTARLPLSLSPFYRWEEDGSILGWLMPL